MVEFCGGFSPHAHSGGARGFPSTAREDPPAFLGLFFLDFPAKVLSMAHLPRPGARHCGGNFRPAYKADSGFPNPPAMVAFPVRPQGGRGSQMLPWWKAARIRALWWTVFPTQIWATLRSPRDAPPNWLQAFFRAQEGSARQKQSPDGPELQSTLPPIRIPHCKPY